MRTLHSSFFGDGPGRVNYSRVVTPKSSRAASGPAKQLLSGYFELETGKSPAGSKFISCCGVEW
jgi:hypothetical protein